MTTGEFASTTELLRAAQQGDATSFRALVERYRPRVLERVRLLLGDGVRRWVESVDVAQMAILDLLVEFDRIAVENDRSLMRWLTAVARNTIRDEARRCRAHGLETKVDGLAPPTELLANDPTPPSEADRSEQLARLRSLLDELPTEARRVVEGRHFEGRSFREIGLELGRSENSAQLLHARALRQLGERLHGDGPGVS